MRAPDSFEVADAVLPRRVKEWLALAFLVLFVAATPAAVRLVTAYATYRSHEIVREIVPMLTGGQQPTSSP